MSLPRRMAILLALTLAACAPAAERPAPATGLTLQPVATGLNVVGAGQEIGFGRHQPGAIAAVTRVLGRGPDSVTAPPGCGLARAQWARDGLSLYFAGEAFVGWAAGEGRAFPGPRQTGGQVC